MISILRSNHRIVWVFYQQTSIVFKMLSRFEIGIAVMDMQLINSQV